MKFAISQDLAFPRNYSVEMTDPASGMEDARHFSFRSVGGIKPLVGVRFLPRGGTGWAATFSAGYDGQEADTGIYSHPNPSKALIVVAGQAYLIDVAFPENCIPLPGPFPITDVLPVPTHGLLLLIDHTDIEALGSDGTAWQTGQIADGAIVPEVIRGNILSGTLYKGAWATYVPFRIDVRSGAILG